MKKNTSLFIILLLSVLTASQATAQSSKWMAGIQLGPGLSSMRGNVNLEKIYDPALGFSGGLTMQHNFNSRFSIRTEALFDRKAQKRELTIVDANAATLGEATVYSQFDGLTVPLMVRYTSGEKRLRVFVNAGPQLFYLLRHGYSTPDDEFERFFDNSDDTENFKSVDLGLAVGAGVSYDLSDKFQFSAEVRDHLGFTDISDTELVDGGSISLNAISLQLNLSYKFGGS